MVQVEDDDDDAVTYYSYDDELGEPIFYREKVIGEDVGLPSQPLPVVGEESSNVNIAIMEEQEEEEVVAIPDFENEEIVREEAEDVLD